jgi:gamma-glutamylcyclotransferase (GGCT)/AIG2-like uncharacterized protein YtfP
MWAARAASPGDRSGGRVHQPSSASHATKTASDPADSPLQPAFWGILFARGRAVKFFAVGTNMDEARMRQLVPSARRLTVASLPGFVLKWHKRSAEGGKLNAVRTGHPDDVVWGVVYELDRPGSKHIDEAQRAAGYREERVTVIDPVGMEHDVVLYVARPDMIDESVLPTQAYRDPIVAAARTNALPPGYVDELARTPVTDD